MKKISKLPKNRIILFANGQWLKDSNGVILFNKRHRMKPQRIKSNYRQAQGSFSTNKTCSGCGNCKKS